MIDPMPYLPFRARHLVRRIINILHASPTPVPPSTPQHELSEAERQQIEFIRDSSLFEIDWYLLQHPELAEQAIDPIVHYLTKGAALGFDPCRAFSTNGYLEDNPDVAAAQVNPFFHFLTHGRQEGRRLGGRDDYASWFFAYKALADSERAALRAEISRFQRSPLISVLIPVFSPAPHRIRRSIESVRAQLYTNWQLCISDHSPGTSEISAVLEEYANGDPRIRIVRCATSGNICESLNAALQLAKGEFCTVLYGEDELAEHALFWIANEILQHPDIDLIYTDEDKVDSADRHFDPHFKPDWNPALILSQDFVSRLAVYRRTLIERLDGFRVGFEGAQGYDLALRCSDASSPDRIRHIPRVLYHRRELAKAKTSQAMETKADARDPAARSVEEHLVRNGLNGTVHSKLGQYYQVKYTLTCPAPKVSIVMPSACNLRLLMPCLNSLFARTTYPDFEVVLVINRIRFDNVDQAYYLDSLKDNSRVRILVYEDRPYNYSWLNNWAVAQLGGSIICLMNDDIEVITHDWLEKLVARLQLSGVGAVGTMLYYPNNTIQHAGVILGLGGVAGHAFIDAPRGHEGYCGRAALEQDLSCVTAACMVIKRKAFDQVSGFNEDLAVAFNDVDFCVRLRLAGWRIIWTPEVEMYHHESASIGKHDSPERHALFQEEIRLVRTLWGDILDNDPCYNPNLSLSSNNFALAYPPRIGKLPDHAAEKTNELNECTEAVASFR